MNWNQLLVQCTIWVLYLFCQSFLMNGIKIASEGRSEVRPDGTIMHSEMIFARVAAYLNQHTMIRVYYTGDELVKLLTKIKDKYPQLTINTEFPITDNYTYMYGDQKSLWERLKENIESVFDVQSTIRNGYEIAFYREYTQYRFSKYIRKPIFGCIVCMPSFWGLFTNLIPGIAVFGLHWWNIPVYLANAGMLAFLNYKLYKPL